LDLIGNVAKPMSTMGEIKVRDGAIHDGGILSPPVYGEFYGLELPDGRPILVRFIIRT
jgi:hypothetical protein